jgi:hypothetical protein
MATFSEIFIIFGLADAAASLRRARSQPSPQGSRFAGTLVFARNSDAQGDVNQRSAAC